MSSERAQHDDGAHEPREHDTAGHGTGPSGSAQDGPWDTTAGATGPPAPAAAGTGGGTPEAPGAPGSAAAVGTQGTDRESRRHRSPLVVASVALAVLLAGGGGAYVAATSSDGSGTPAAAGDGGTPPKLALDDLAQAPATSGRKSEAHGIAPGEPNPNSRGGPLYRATGELPEGPSSAPVYRSTGSPTEEQVRRLAEALHVEGAPRRTEHGWQVGQVGGDSGSLQVTREAPGQWSFSRRVPAGGSSDGSAVSEKEARKVAAPVLAAVGQQHAKIDAGQVSGTGRQVRADPVVGGLPTFGWSTQVRVGADGQVVSANGRMLTPTRGATYPVLGAEETLGLLNKSGFRPHACPAAVPHARQADQGSKIACFPPGAPEGRRPVIPVRGATFGLATHSVEGRPILVPAWFFDVRPQGSPEGYVRTHPAVDPEYLVRGDGHPLPKPSSSDGTRIEHPTSYSVEGRSLTVRFWGGVCSSYEVRADETADKVTVTVIGHPKPGGQCIAIAKKFSKTVQLDEPLGDRTVVDDSGRTIHRG